MRAVCGRTEHRLPKGRGRGGVLVREHVAVDPQRDLDVGVPDPSADHLDRYASHQGGGDVRVPEVVEPDPRQG